MLGDQPLAVVRADAIGHDDDQRVGEGAADDAEMLGDGCRRVLERFGRSHQEAAMLENARLVERVAIEQKGR